MDEKIERYILDIVFATRKPEDYKLNKISSSLPEVKAASRLILICKLQRPIANRCPTPL